MALLKEIIYDVREALKEFSDDSELDNRYIKYLYNIKRAKYLRQDLNNYLKTVDLSITQTLCLPMSLVDGDECGGDCPKLLRSNSPIPKPLELHSKVAITSVKPTDRIAVPFNFVSKEKIAYIEGAQFASGLYSFLDNDNYIYVYSLDDSYKLLNCLTVTGIFENPSDLSNYSNCCDCNTGDNKCFDEDNSDYPLQPHYIDLIKAEIVSDYAKTSQVIEDTENDANDR